MKKTFRVFAVFPLMLCSQLVWADIDSVIEQLNTNQSLYNAASVTHFYKQQQSLPKWSLAQIKDLVKAIEASAQHGLIPADYHLASLKAPVGVSNKKDILATDAFLTLARHILRGKLNPVTLEPTWNAKPRSKNLVTLLANALSQDDIAVSLEALEPQQPRYRVMKRELAKYQRIQEHGDWPTVTEGPMLQLGAESSRVTQLRKRLAVTGDVSAADNKSRVFDTDLLAAVKEFQRRTNLVPDGIVGPETLHQLNLGLQDRIDQIRVNLERWRWLPEEFGEKHIRVNIADYQLEAHEGDTVAAVYDVVVGQTYRQTPVFSANMVFLMLNPWWDIPNKLAREDVLPKLQADPGLYQEMGYQVLDKDGTVLLGIDWAQYSAQDFPYRMRQKPSDKNTLGKVKFIFPNQHSIYLHDTVLPELFRLKRRDFSSGCIRVDSPITLVEWVLEDNLDWPRDKIDSTLASNKPTRINLDQPIPVHLYYWTVVVEDLAGKIRFLEDIYQRDAKVLEMLNQRP